MVADGISPSQFLDQENAEKEEKTKNDPLEQGKEVQLEENNQGKCIAKEETGIGEENTSIDTLGLEKDNEGYEISTGEYFRENNEEINAMQVECRMAGSQNKEMKESGEHAPGKCKGEAKSTKDIPEEPCRMGFLESQEPGTQTIV
ncbi:uncharacterized protein O3C94_018985 [Discoglossus pictus]